MCQQVDLKRKLSANSDPVSVGVKKRRVDDKPLIVPEFEISSFYIGQGDCYLIKCPDNSYVMIDCGSALDFRRPKMQIRAKLRQKNITKIKALIITHSDSDHHNQVDILDDESIEIEQVIVGVFSLGDYYFNENPKADAINEQAGRDLKPAFDQMKAQDKWDQWCKFYTRNNKSTLKTLNDNRCKCKTFVGLEINRGGQCSYTYSVLNNTVQEPVLIEQLKQGHYEVCGGENWSIKIIAAKVDEEKIGSKYKPITDRPVYMNAASLVTVIGIRDKAALFTGDSTGATFRYLLEDSAEWTKKIFQKRVFEVLQVPHHGSNKHGSDSQAFINATNPRYLITSVRFKHGGMHNLPKWAALTKWKENPHIEKNDPDGHYFGYWITKEELKQKKIFNVVDLPPEDRKAVDWKELEKCFDFYDNLRKGEYELHNLKYDATPHPVTKEPRKNNLFVLGGVNHKYYFVIQRTKKQIATNGVNAASKFLIDKINKAWSDTIDISKTELKNEISNDVGGSKYWLTENGAALKS